MKRKLQIKLCPSCHRRRYLKAFTSHDRRVDGVRIWCDECVAHLFAGAPAQAKLRRQYHVDRARAYQLWFRTVRGYVMLDKRVAFREGVSYVMRWSRRRDQLAVIGSWPELEKIRTFLVRYFEVDPASLYECGRGGGSGMRRHETCRLEGSVDEKTWREGREALKAEDWTITRKDHDDIVAEGR